MEFLDLSTKTYIRRPQSLTTLNRRMLKDIYLLIFLSIFTYTCIYILLFYCSFGMHKVTLRYKMSEQSYSLPHTSIFSYSKLISQLYDVCS